MLLKNKHSNVTTFVHALLSSKRANAAGKGNSSCVVHALAGTQEWWCLLHPFLVY